MHTALVAETEEDTQLHAEHPSLFLSVRLQCTVCSVKDVYKWDTHISVNEFRESIWNGVEWRETSECLLVIVLVHMNKYSYYSGYS